MAYLLHVPCCTQSHKTKHFLHLNNADLVWHQISLATPLHLLLFARCTKQFAVAQMHNMMILEYIFWLLHPPFLSFLHPVAWLPWALKSCELRAPSLVTRAGFGNWEAVRRSIEPRSKVCTIPLLWGVQPLPLRCKGQWAGKKQIYPKAQLIP